MKLATTLLVFCVGALLSLGFVMLYSVGMFKGGAHYLIMQLIWAGAGLIIAATVAGVDYKWFRKGAWVLLGLAGVLLVGVLLTAATKGSRRWFRLGSMNFQPSEFAKLALIIALAHYGDTYQRVMGTFRRGLLVPGGLICMIIALIFVEPDRGASILLTSVSGIMLVLAGVRLYYIIPPILCSAVALGFCLWRDPVRHRRILSWLYLEDHKQGAGYQVWRSIVGFGSGGVDGIGLGNGREKAFIPEHHTDFIFSVVGEELGLVATLATLLTFAVVVACGLYIARHARDMFGFLLGSGITFLIGLQAAFNVGVVTGALPNKGLPLPFISYGGSNLLLMLTSVGLLLSIARHAPQRSDALSKTNRVPDLEATALPA